MREIGFLKKLRNSQAEGRHREERSDAAIQKPRRWRVGGADRRERQRLAFCDPGSPRFARDDNPRLGSSKVA